MLILGQSGDVMVNLERIQAITTYCLGDFERGKKVEKKCRVLALFGTGEDDCWGIGDYETEDRAKEIIKEIWEKYGEFLHRRGGQAILKWQVDVSEAFWVLPKIYEMPKE